MVVRGEVQSALGSQITARIREAAGEKGLSGREVARRVGKSNTWLMNLYSGKQSWRIDDVEDIAAVLEVPPEQLLGIGVYAFAPEFLPPPVQRLVDRFAESVMARYSRAGVSPAQQRGLLTIVGKAWEFVEKGMSYWEAELQTKRPEPGLNSKPSNGTARGGRKRP